MDEFKKFAEMRKGAAPKVVLFRHPEATFRRLDADKDGKLTKEEFSKLVDQLPGKSKAQFKADAVVEEVPECADCGKPLPLCICDSITPIENRVDLLILQHPQEQDRALGTARLAALPTFHWRRFQMRLVSPIASTACFMRATSHFEATWRNRIAQLHRSGVN